MKIPVDYAWDQLSNHLRGYDHVQRFDRDAIAQIAVNGLLRVTQLRPFFRNNRAYQEWRRMLLVPHRYWQGNMELYPENRAYARRQMRVNPDNGSRPASPRMPNRRRSAGRNSPPPRSRSASPIRARSPQRVTPRYRRGELHMESKLGEFTTLQRRNAPRSTLSIRRMGDECDDNDVNLPKPVCKAIRKACRRYNINHQYLPLQTDGSETNDYDIRVSYE